MLPVIVKGIPAVLLIVHEYDVLSEVFPAASNALTEKVCPPVASLLYEVGVEHGAYVPASSLHWKLTPDSPSLKANCAPVAAVGFDGLEVIFGAGGALVSIVNVTLAGEP